MLTTRTSESHFGEGYWSGWGPPPKDTYFFVNSHNTESSAFFVPGEKPFACEICGEKFARTDVLGLHRKKHLNFAQLQNPGHHSQTSHPDQTSQPDQTSHPSQEIQPSQTIHEQQGMRSQGDVESQAVASASMPHVFVSPVVLPVVELPPANYQHM